MNPRAFPAPLGAAEAWPIDIDWSLGFMRPETILARDYWLSHSKDGLMPSRADLTASEMKGFMSNVGLIEVRPRLHQPDYFIRLAGSRWEAVFGAMKGKLLHEFLPKHIEDRWRHLFDSVYRLKAPLRATTRIGFKNKIWLATEMLVAPLGDDGETVSMLFMCFTTWNVNDNKP